jgi:predicted MFS family arabinose efflux permease
VLLGSGLTLQAVGLAWLAVVARASTPYLDLVPGFILAGIGMGLTFAPSATAVLADMAPDDHATASSTNSTIREIGVALGVAVLVAVFQANGGALTPEGYDTGLRAAILTGAVAVALGALSTLWLPRTRTHRP